MRRPEAPSGDPRVGREDGGADIEEGLHLCLVPRTGFTTHEVDEAVADRRVIQGPSTSKTGRSGRARRRARSWRQSGPSASALTRSPQRSRRRSSSATAALSAPTSSPSRLRSPSAWPRRSGASSARRSVGGRRPRHRRPGPHQRLLAPGGPGGAGVWPQPGDSAGPQQHRPEPASTVSPATVAQQAPPVSGSTVRSCPSAISTCSRTA